MTKTMQVCNICGLDIGVCHGHEEPALISEHIRLYHPSAYLELAYIHEQLEELKDSFKELSGRYARESFYYRKERMK